ncbi:RAD52 motif-containing protein 1, partial [Sphaerodactylus townsendi]|uniref:RAD52 motif-containing protein 1 n=1 Tax=Sphaerodactylus townsendi TaxID=933632 RepID=UPI002025F764
VPVYNISSDNENPPKRVSEIRNANLPARQWLSWSLCPQVCLCTRQGPFPQQTLVLNSHKCQELANHYLGFNGWSNRIVTLQDISGLEEEETEEEGSRALPQSQHRKYLCIQELTIPRHSICARGIAVAEVPVDPSQGNNGGGGSRGHRALVLQKLAAQKALSDAFQKILLIVLENGKVAVEFCSPQEDLVDCLADEELKGLLQVMFKCMTDFSFSQLNPEGEEEVLSDFSMDGE